MNRFFTFISVVLINCFLFSCTKDIEIDIPIPKKKFVVYSTIVPFSLPRPKDLNLKLHSSSYIFDTVYPEINDALVLFYENDILKDTLKYSDKSEAYIISVDIGSYPEEGYKYSIKISKTGFSEVVASTVIPTKIEIDSVFVTPIVFLDDTKSAFSEISVTFTDNGAEKNYYELAVSNITFDYDNDDSFYRLSSNDNIITSESYYPSLLSLELKKPKKLLFNDETINGQTYTLHVYYCPPQIESDHRYINYHYLSIHLRNVTEEYYEFGKTMIQNMYSKEEDFLYGMSEPINVSSNISNGYGLFSGFNHDIVSLLIDSVLIY